MKTFYQFLEEIEPKKNISYSAVLLDEKSHNKLLSEVSKYIPEGWKIFAHHMTINMGPLKPPDDSLLGQEVNLVASEIGISDMAIAVKVDGFKSKNKIPHITVAVNTPAGGKPVMSNEITNWQPISIINLKGTVSEVAR